MDATHRHPYRLHRPPTLTPSVHAQSNFSPTRADTCHLLIPVTRKSFKELIGIILPFNTSIFQGCVLFERKCKKEKKKEVGKKKKKKKKKDGNWFFLIFG